MNEVIITILGEDSVGIITEVCTRLAAERINVLGVNQTIVQDYFHMMMTVDILAAEGSLKKFMDVMQKLGEEVGLRIHMQREEIFEVMHCI